MASPLPKTLEALIRIDKVNSQYGSIGMAKIKWIISRYFHYLYELLAHGYKVFIYYDAEITKATLQLYWGPYQKPPRRKGKMFMYSTIRFGYMFYLYIKGKEIDNFNYEFHIDTKLRRRIEKELNTDAIYQFVKE